MSSHQLAAALAYASRGWHVLPLREHGKEPATERGIYDATIDPVTIERWFRRRNFNIGIRTGRASRLFVVDIDPGGDLMGLTPTVETGRGWQVYFETDLGLPSTAGRLGPHVDTRGEGGYVVAPPSVHPNGKAYRWVHQGEGGDADPPILTNPVPDWLIERLRKSTISEQAIAAAKSPPRNFRPNGYGYGEAALAGELQTLVRAPKGRRNTILNLVGFKLFRLVGGGELAESTVKAALIDACQRNGLIQDDGIGSVVRTIKSAMAGLQHPRGRAAR
jgi:hypothetical protein